MPEGGDPTMPTPRAGSTVASVAVNCVLYVASQTRLHRVLVQNPAKEGRWYAWDLVSSRLRSAWA